MTPVCAVLQRGLEVQENREEIRYLIQQGEAVKYDEQTAVTELFILRHVDIMATGGVAPCILNIGTSCRRVVTLTPGYFIT
jgi:hypothetical protein